MTPTEADMDARELDDSPPLAAFRGIVAGVLAGTVLWAAVVALVFGG